MKQTDTVSFVVDSHMCTACGGCCGVCPEDAIEMIINNYGIYTPIIDHEKCTKCGLCVEVCPGHEFNYWEHQERIFGTKNIDPAIGHVIETMAGHTTDSEMHLKVQSGGLISGLVIYCLENNIASGAVVARWKKSEPFTPEVYIAKNRVEVLDAVGSKYNPIPSAIMIKELLKLDGKYIFVGTSCQIHAFRKAEKIFPQLQNKIVLYLGLHCEKVFNYHYHEQILFKIKERRSNIKYFRFRDKVWRGWPCDMRLENMVGRAYDLSGPYSRGWPRSYFSNYRCQLCFDKFNEFSDISCGDCRIASVYGKKTLKDALYNNNPGKSDIVIRSKRGKAIFDQVIAEGLFETTPTMKADVIKAVAVAKKKLGVNDFRLFAKLFGLSHPNYGVKFDLVNRKDKLIDFILKPWSVIASAHYYLCHKLMKNRLFRSSLKLMPHRFLFYIATARELPVSHVFFRRRTNLSIKEFKSYIKH